MSLSRERRLEVKRIINNVKFYFIVDEVPNAEGHIVGRLEVVNDNTFPITVDLMKLVEDYGPVALKGGTPRYFVKGKSRTTEMYGLSYGVVVHRFVEDFAKEGFGTYAVRVYIASLFLEVIENFKVGNRRLIRR